MKKIIFTKTEHNGVECWKDETGLFMVKKDLIITEKKPKFDLFIAKRDCSQLTNECHSWGYEELYKGFESKEDTIYEVKIIINYIFNSISLELFNDYQYKLIYDTYFE